MYSAHYSILRFFVGLELPMLCMHIMFMFIWAALYPAPVWYFILTTVLTPGKLLHNYDWYSLTWFILNACTIAQMLALNAPWLNSLVPHSIWNARHAWTLYFTLQIIMILHHLEPKRIKSTHWTCKHEVCSTVYHIHNMPTDTAFERHKAREKTFDLLNPPRHGSHGCLEEGEKAFLQTNSLCHPSRFMTTASFWNPRENGRKTWRHRCSCLFLRCATHAECPFSSLRPLP